MQTLDHTHNTHTAQLMHSSRDWWQMTLVIILSYVYVRDRRRREAYHHNFNNSFSINKTWALDFALPEWKALRKVNVITVLTSLNLTGPLSVSLISCCEATRKNSLDSNPSQLFNITERANTTTLQPCLWSKQIHDCARKMSINIKTNGVEMSEDTEQLIWTRCRKMAFNLLRCERSSNQQTL